jgi:hypothetical protein
MVKHPIYALSVGGLYKTDLLLKIGHFNVPRNSFSVSSQNELGASEEK